MHVRSRLLKQCARSVMARAQASIHHFVLYPPCTRPVQYFVHTFVDSMQALCSVVAPESRPSPRLRCFELQLKGFRLLARPQALHPHMNHMNQ